MLQTKNVRATYGRQWAHTVDFRKFLGDGEDREAMQAAVLGIKEELARKLPEKLNRQLALILAEMSQAADLEKLEWFNASLNRLWDFLDRHRVWVAP